MNLTVNLTSNGPINIYLNDSKRKGFKSKNTQTEPPMDGYRTRVPSNIWLNQIDPNCIRDQTNVNESKDYQTDNIDSKTKQKDNTSLGDGHIDIAVKNFREYPNQQCKLTGKQAMFCMICVFVVLETRTELRYTTSNIIWSNILPTPSLPTSPSESQSLQESELSTVETASRYSVTEQTDTVSQPSESIGGANISLLNDIAQPETFNIDHPAVCLPMTHHNLAEIGEQSNEASELNRNEGETCLQLPNYDADSDDECVLFQETFTCSNQTSVTDFAVITRCAKAETSDVETPIEQAGSVNDIDVRSDMIQSFQRTHLILEGSTSDALPEITRRDPEKSNEFNKLQETSQPSSDCKNKKNPNHIHRRCVQSRNSFTRRNDTEEVPLSSLIDPVDCVQQCQTSSDEDMPLRNLIESRCENDEEARHGPGQIVCVEHTDDSLEIEHEFHELHIRQSNSSNEGLELHSFVLRVDLEYVQNLNVSENNTTRQNNCRYNLSRGTIFHSLISHLAAESFRNSNVSENNTNGQYSLANRFREVTPGLQRVLVFDTNERDLFLLEEANIRLRAFCMCEICCSNLSSCVIISCGHTGCYICLNRRTRCHVCGLPIGRFSLQRFYYHPNNAQC